MSFSLPEIFRKLQQPLFVGSNLISYHPDYIIVTKTAKKYSFLVETQKQITTKNNPFNTQNMKNFINYVRLTVPLPEHSQTLKYTRPEMEETVYGGEAIPWERERTNHKVTAIDHSFAARKLHNQSISGVSFSKGVIAYLSTVKSMSLLFLSILEGQSIVADNPNALTEHIYDLMHTIMELAPVINKTLGTMTIKNLDGTSSTFSIGGGMDMVEGVIINPDYEPSMQGYLAMLGRLAGDTTRSDVLSIGADVLRGVTP